MPMKSNYRKRNPLARRKRKAVYKKKRMPLISVANRGVSFKRIFFSTGWAFGTAATSDFWRKITPRFAELPNYLEYQSLFDEFKMTGIKVTFHPRFGSTFVGLNNATVQNNQMYITLSESTRDHEVVPSGSYSSATYNTFLEEFSSRSRTYKFDKPVSLYFKPTIYDETGTPFGTAHRKCPWMAIADSTQIRMHGMHAFIHDYNFTNVNAASFGCDIQYTFYFQCRGQQ